MSNVTIAAIKAHPRFAELEAAINKGKTEAETVDWVLGELLVNCEDCPIDDFVDCKIETAKEVYDNRLARGDYEVRN